MNEKCEYLKQRILEECKLEPDKEGVTSKNVSFLTYIFERKKALLKKNRKMRELYIEVDDEITCFIYLDEAEGTDPKPSRIISKNYFNRDIEKAFEGIKTVIEDNLLAL